MAKRICPHCKEKADYKATVCPHCTKSLTPVSFWKTRTGIIVIVVAAWLGLGIVGQIFKGDKERTKELADQSVIEKNKQAIAVAQEKLRAKFSAEKEIIIADMKVLLKDKKYNEVIARSAPYLFTNDTQLLATHNLAKEQIFLKDLKNTSELKWEEKKNLYTQLVKLDPGNSEYKKKVEFYVKKIEEKNKEELARIAKKNKEERARIAKFGNPPEQSGWDGSYRPVKRYLEEKANDPSSIEVKGCTPVSYSNEGWLVACDYRGKNAFGAMVLNSNWFVIINDTVVDVKPITAYSQK